MNHKFLLFAVAVFCGIFTAVSPAAAQGTRITYQGALKDAGSPANGTYDLTFTVFGAVTNGGSVGGPLTNTGVAVSNGVFTVPLDFGAGVFTGADRWLEIGVRTNGGGSFATLAPRQAVTATPYAVYALTPAGPAGPPGVVQSGYGADSLGTIAANSLIYVFAGARTSGMTLTNGQRVLIQFSAAIGTTASSEPFDLSPAYTLNGGSVTITNPIDYFTCKATSAGGRPTYCMNQIFTVITTGTYVFGIGVSNWGASALNDNDWSNITVLVLN